jgi:hypothetical protein
MKDLISLLSPSSLAGGLRFAGKLPHFLRTKMETEQAEDILKNRLQNREKRFLSLVKKCIYEHKNNPYFLLLEHAGCEYGDIENLVAHEGVEGTLGDLLHNGVFLRVDEYKGHASVQRGSLRLKIDQSQLWNPFSSFHVPVKSGGSRGSGTPVRMDFDFISESAVNSCLMFHARNGFDWIKADWEVPGRGALFRLLKFSRFGQPPRKWFSQVDPAASDLHPRYRWSANILRWGSLMAGVPLPKVEYVPPDDPMPIILWLKQTLDDGRTPCVFTFPSSAVILCHIASESGIDLKGARFLISGEPITEAKLKTITQAGGIPLSRYGTVECGPLGYGCLHPKKADDMHLLSDLHAFVQADDLADELGMPAGGVFVTSLNDSEPFMFLNVSMGDQAVLEEINCGCALQDLGWKTHISQIRSFEKLTGAGMTFLDTDIIQILEEILPSRFGGAPTDYQLIEGENERGEPVLQLRIHPSLGPLDEEQVIQVFLQSISAGQGSARIVGFTWEKTGLLQVDRRPPQGSSSGKILHLFLNSSKME